jgi:hypothetical protein
VTTRAPNTAFAVALALGAATLGGCGASGPAPGPTARKGGPIVSLKLHGDQGDEQLLACSLVHHYAVFPSGRLIAYDGAVRPAPTKHWKVKVKIKRCVDGRFDDSGTDRITGGFGGRYSGQLQAPGKGVFFARTRFRTPSGDVLSDKVYFEVR